MHPALFLDRDGVLMENRPDYVRSWADVDIYPEALQAIVQASGTPYKIVIITNQSAVGRGIISLETAQEINNRLVEVIQAAGGRVDGVYLCPHAPHEACECRKPRPGLLLQAAEALRIDLSRSIMVGDAISDLLAGQAAGVKRLALVRTGRGTAQARLPEAAQIHSFVTYNSLAEALKEML
jgi:D-glycero-D-manno-heptose 1,7-bisphosphate phosphatase